MSNDEKRRQLPLISGLGLNTRSFEAGYRTSGETRARNRRHAGRIARAFFLVVGLLVLVNLLAFLYFNAGAGAALAGIVALVLLVTLPRLLRRKPSGS